MATNFTPEQLRAMFTGHNKSMIYEEAARLYYKLKVHADGEMPIWLIKKARPHESTDAGVYREDIYEAETQNPIEQVLSVFEKIHRSPDFMIRFDEEAPAIIAKDETPEKYLTENYPVYGSIEYWLFEEALRCSCLDANAVIVVMPLSFALTNAYVKPVARIFNSPSVVQFVAEDYAILKSDEFSSLLTPIEQEQRLNNSILARTSYDKTQLPVFIPGQVYYVINTIFYQKWEETKEGKYQLTEIYNHNRGKLPAFQMPGKYVKRIGNSILKKSLLNPMIPHLNKAARAFNDLDLGVILHLHIQKWRINNKKCIRCNGTGKIPSANGVLPCPASNCKDGYVTGNSPFDEVEIKPAAIGEQNVPMPPIGEVQKNPQILVIANEFAEKHIYKALASVQMQHLGDVQLNQSGVAKQWDNDGINNMVYMEAEGLINIINMVTYWTIELRYADIVPNQELRKKMLPIIPVPEKFDIINTSMLLAEYQIGKTAGLNGIILAELQKEIAQKKFYGNPEVSAFVETVMDLDPFPDKTVDEKTAMESNGLAAKEDVILSNYISDFVKESMENDKTFNNKTNIQKREILTAMAKAKVEEMSVATQVTQDIFGVPPAPPVNGVPANGLPIAQPAIV